MRLTVAAWTNVQNHLDLSDHEQKLLDIHIEQRTFGKRWGQEVGIALHKKHERMVIAAQTRIPVGMSGHLPLEGIDTPGGDG